MSRPGALVQSRLVESAGAAVRVLTFSRPDKKNALTPPMLTEFRHHLGTACEGAGAVLIDGEGAAFCAGFDLTLCKENSEALRELLVGLSSAIRAMRTCPAPVVLAVHGAAIAGGCALLGGADVVITHTDCKLGYPVVRLGISPAVSGPFFAAAVGHGQSRERMLSTQLMSGWDAYRAGLAHECLEDAGKVRTRGLAVAQQMAAKPWPSMSITKSWLNEIDGTARAELADAALLASLSLVGSSEERSRLAELWKSA